jgi:pyruvate dehydrogenase kinase 2/3/4
MLRKILRIENYSKIKPTLLKLNEIYSIGTQESILIQSQFLHKELPIRLAHRTRELYELPENVINTIYLQNVYDLYANSFERILDHPYPKKESDITSFAHLIKDIKDKHNNLEINIARAIYDEKYNLYINSYDSDKQKIDEILTNFYMSRIGIRFLIGQYLQIVNQIKVNKNQRGMIHRLCNPYNITKDVIDNVKAITECVSYDTEINYKIIGNNDLQFLYIPSHLNYILFEVIKNSVQAIINLNKVTDEKTIIIDIKKGKKDIIIRVSDKAGGFSRDYSDLVFSFLFSTSKEDLNSIINNTTILSGFGHGLGLSRLYARYLGGDIKIISSEGVGTDTYIFLKILDADETIADYSI